MHGVLIECTRPGKPTDNGIIESFDGKLRDECFNQNAFLSIRYPQNSRSQGAGFNQQRLYSS